MKRAESLVERADIVLLLSAEGRSDAMCAANPSKVIPVQSKCDLLPKDVKASENPQSAAFIRVSSVTGEGLADLKAAIVARLESLAGAATDGSASTSERERSLLQSAFAALANSHLGDLVLLANDLRACAETLGLLIGATYSSDLLDSLFSRFCVGK